MERIDDPDLLNLNAIRSIAGEQAGTRLVVALELGEPRLERLLALRHARGVSNGAEHHVGCS